MRATVVASRFKLALSSLPFLALGFSIGMTSKLVHKEFSHFEIIFFKCARCVEMHANKVRKRTQMPIRSHELNIVMLS